MLRFILLILVSLYFGIPYLYQQVLAKETKIIEMNGQEWLLIIESGKEPMLKPIEKEQTETSVSVKPEWQRKTVKESKMISTCDDPMGCEMTIEGDCPSCKTELIREETVEVVQKSDFIDFKNEIKAKKKLSNLVNSETLPFYLQSYQYIRDLGHPEWICIKVSNICNHGDPITIQDLYLGKINASYCKSRNYWVFDFSNPIDSCSKSTILNL